MRTPLDMAIIQKSIPFVLRLEAEDILLPCISTAGIKKD